jgi:hypothetical protein
MSRVIYWLSGVSIIATLSLAGWAWAGERPYYALPAAALTAGVPTDTTVNYETAGATLGEVLTEVGQQTGVQVMAASPYLDRRVAVRVQGQPLRTFLEDLAQLLRCKWRVGGGILLLSPLSAAALPEAGAPQSEWAPALKELINSLTPEQKAALDAGGAVIFAGLLPEQKVALKALLAASASRRPPQYYSNGSLVEYPDEGWKIMGCVAENDVWELTVTGTAPADTLTGQHPEHTSHFTYRGLLAPKLEAPPEESEEAPTS